MLHEPYVIESSGRGSERSYPLFSRLLKDRIIIISNEIVDDTATVVCSQLLYLEQKDPKAPIYIYINTPGGSVTAGLAIYDTMKFIDCEIVTIAMGQACSMGSFLLTAGDRRYSLPNTTIMYHSVSSGFQGTIQDHEIEFLETQRLQKLLLTTIINSLRDGLDEAQIKEIKNKIKRNWYVSPELAMEYGLIDKVIKNRQEAKQ